MQTSAVLFVCNLQQMEIKCQRTEHALSTNYKLDLCKITACLYYILIS